MARHRGGKVIDRKEWTGTLQTTQVISTNTTVAGGFVLFNIPGIVLRCRGYVQAFMDNTK